MEKRPEIKELSNGKFRVVIPCIVLTDHNYYIERRSVAVFDTWDEAKEFALTKYKGKVK